MKLATSYFGKLKKLSDDEYAFFSIAGKTPEWFLNEENHFIYHTFAPKYEWWKEWKEKFIDNYESDESKAFYISKYKDTILNSLNADAIAKQLLLLSNGKTPCLLCYETPEKFCHRHIVANWFKENGIECEEA